MKNRWFPFLVAMPIVTGICGAILRAAQMTRAFDAETGIFESGSPFSVGLVAVSIIALLMALIGAFVLKNGVQTKTASDDGKSVAVSSAFAALLILAHAGVIIYGLKVRFDAASLVFALLSVYCAASLLAMGKYRLAERDSTAYCVFSAVPVFWACFLLIITFREKISDPIIGNYAILIFAYICILLFVYSLSAHILGRNRFAVMVFSCFLGIYFIITEHLSPIIAAFMSQDVTSSALANAGELLPSLAFLIFMPPATALIARRK